MCMWKTFTLPLSVCETVTKVRRAAIVKWTTMSGFLGDYRGARGGQVPGAVRARPSSQMRSAAHSITQTSFAAPLHTDLRQDSARCEPSLGMVPV